MWRRGTSGSASIALLDDFVEVLRREPPSSYLYKSSDDGAHHSMHKSVGLDKEGELGVFLMPCSGGDMTAVMRHTSMSLAKALTVKLSKEMGSRLIHSLDIQREGAKITCIRKKRVTHRGDLIAVGAV